MEKIKILTLIWKYRGSSWAAWGLEEGSSSRRKLTSEHEQKTRAFLDAAEEIGIDFFDHANIYGRGRSEEVFGRVLRERPSLRDRIVLQSKCGIRWQDDPPGTPQRFDFRRDHILESVDAILSRLGTDRLEILLLTALTVFGKEKKSRRLSKNSARPARSSISASPTRTGSRWNISSRSSLPSGRKSSRDEPVASWIC